MSGCVCGEEARYSDESRLFLRFCPGIATGSACCGVDPLTPGNSGGLERASLPARRSFDSPRGPLASASAGRGLSLPTRLLALWPAYSLVGLDRIGQGREFSLLGRAFSATIKGVRSRDKQRVHAVGDGRRGLHGWAALAEGIQILGRGVDLRFHARHLRFESLHSVLGYGVGGSRSRRNGLLSTEASARSPKRVGEENSLVQLKPSIALAALACAIVGCAQNVIPESAL